MWVVSSMSKKILVICEGTKKEPEIIQYAQKLDLLPENLQIVSYGTNIYKLYNALEKKVRDIRMVGILLIFSFL